MMSLPQCQVHKGHLLSFQSKKRCTMIKFSYNHNQKVIIWFYLNMASSIDNISRVVVKKLLSQVQVKQILAVIMVLLVSQSGVHESCKITIRLLYGAVIKVKLTSDEVLLICTPHQQHMRVPIASVSCQPLLAIFNYSHQGG